MIKFLKIKINFYLNFLAEYHCVQRRKTDKSFKILPIIASSINESTPSDIKIHSKKKLYRKVVETFHQRWEALGATTNNNFESSQTHKRN